MIASNGITRFGLGQRVFSNAIVPAIPIEEQTAIANYLDERIAKLDKLINNKEYQIEKLKEIRQIEINTTVTKGLNPKARMKNSAIKWLGDIPEHWEVKRIKNVCDVNPKKCDSGFSSDSTMPVVFLPMESVSESGEFDDSVRIPINELWSGFTYFKKGDIVLAKITPCFENGKSACLDRLSTEIGFGTTEFHVLRPSSNRIFNRFIYYITKSEMFMQFGKALMTGAAGQKRVPTEFIQIFKIAVPGRKEQIQITDYLDERISKIDRLILNFVYEIEKLKEIRKIEIYNAVTGKIKVV